MKNTPGKIGGDLNGRQEWDDVLTEHGKIHADDPRDDRTGRADDGTRNILPVQIEACVRRDKLRRARDLIDHIESHFP